MLKKTENLRCDWCYALKQLAKHQSMDLQYAKELADYLKSKGVRTITLIGGEPTLYSQLFELILMLSLRVIKMDLMHLLKC